MTDTERATVATRADAPGPVTVARWVSDDKELRERMARLLAIAGVRVVKR